MFRKFLIVTLMLCLASSCLPLTSPSSPIETPARASSPLNTPLPTSSRTSTLEPGPAIQRARKDLAARLTLNIDAIQVVRVVDDTFPDDGGLGCGTIKPDVVRPAFVTGQSIRLRANNIIYEYRAHGEQLVFCDAVQ